VTAAALRIALDVRCANDHFPGIGRYVAELATALAGLDRGPELALVHDPSLVDTRFHLASLAGSHPLRVTLHAVAAPPVSFAEQVRLPPLARRLRADVWHAPYYVHPYAIRTPTVLTAYDAIGARVPGAVPGPHRRAALAASTWLAFRNARVVIAISEWVGRDLTGAFGLRDDRVRVVPLGVSPSFRPHRADELHGVRARLGLPDRYLLYVGITKPHKNLDGLLRAVARLASDDDDDVPALVVAGAEDERYAPALRRLAGELRLGHDRVRFVGPVDEADLPALHAGAEVFVFPSRQEGFGLPVLEAMASGVAVACSDRSSLPEVAGDAAVLFDPDDPAAIAAGIRRALVEREALGAAGVRRAAQFTWQRTAEATAAVYAEARTAGGRT
jgi:alpha-1,3-rhamnosyl/mannosyltransferase